MECNKDEANRAKEIAEKKFTAKDFTGAKKFALKAQNLYPGLEGLPQMLATLDVYISAENKISGEADWYGILDVNPSADDETVKKQYRKLALMLHPDKNKSVGADGAFKLISEAWSLLSDKTKRMAYDQKCNVKGIQKKAPPPSGGTSAPPGSNGFYNFNNATTSNARTQKSAARGPTAAPASSRTSKPNTFWTACNLCKMQYEYLRIYLNHNLLCPNCHDPFYAVETAPPPSNGSSAPTPWTFPQQRQNSNHHTPNKKSSAPGGNTAPSPNMEPGGFSGVHSFNNTNFQWVPFSRPAGVGSATASASAAAQAASVVQQTYEKVRREREEAQAAARREEALRRKHPKKMGSGASTGVSNSGSGPVTKGERPVKKRRGMDGEGGNTYGSEGASQTSTGTRGAGLGSGVGVKQGSSEMERVTGSSGVGKPNGLRELSQQEIRTMLMEKARAEIRKKLNEWSSAAVAKAADKVKEKKREKVRDKDAVNGGTPVQNKGDGESVDTKKKIHSDKILSGTSGAALDTETVEPMSISVPDPDFHDFDKDRSERSFGDNQVWAAYDDDDGMPRFYAMIHKVISFDPFKMRISWLNSKSNSELGQLNWVSSGFSKICGDFWIGKYEVNKSLNSFSHKVRWTKGARGAIRIFPRKGDVWALYRNWSPDWDELTPDEVIHKYDMVEVLDDYNEEQGVTITPLVKVAGFKTVFHRHLDSGEVKRIPREELFRFSHQVPSYMLTGQEGPNAPKGCRELDPAATPLELLQVITDVKEEEIVENADKVEEEEMVKNAEKAEGENMVENPQITKEEEIVKNVKEAETEKMVENIRETTEQSMAEKAEEQPSS